MCICMYLYMYTYLERLGRASLEVVVETAVPPLQPSAPAPGDICTGIARRHLFVLFFSVRFVVYEVRSHVCDACQPTSLSFFFLLLFLLVSQNFFSFLLVSYSFFFCSFLSLKTRLSNRLTLQRTCLLKLPISKAAYSRGPRAGRVWWLWTWQRHAL